LNDQKGHFIDVTTRSGLAGAYSNETLTLADIDGNGTLDLYACNNRGDDIRDWARIPVMFVNKKPTVPPQLRDRITLANGALLEFGEPDILFLNDGQARFQGMSWTNGTFLDEQGRALTNAPADWGLTAAFRDLNDDGAPDLYVCNDYWTPDRLWFNDGKGRFRAAPWLALRKIPASSMGVDFADVNRDRRVDIFAVDMLSRNAQMRRRQTIAKRPAAPQIGDLESRVQTPQNTLLLNRGDGTFAEVGCFAGLEASDWSWSPMFLDVDLDGHDDVLITAGHLRDTQDFDANARIRAQQESWRRSPMAATNLQRAFVEARREHNKFYPTLEMPTVAFRNLGDGRFQETTSDWGLDTPGVNHGLAVADFDNDGDLDLAVNRLGKPVVLFRNESSAPRVAVRLLGKAPNTQAIGAKIELLGATVSNQIHEVSAGGHYMSGCDTLQMFAPGGTTNDMALRVTWRDGAVTQIAGVQANHFYEIDESSARRDAPSPADPGTTSPAPPSLFDDLSPLLNHVHHEEPFDDFARQPLLPRKLSQAGPGAAWFDLDADGWEDLLVGSGRGGAMAVWHNQRGEQFVRATNALLAAPVSRDQTTVLGWRRASGQSVLLAGAASYEDGDAQRPCVDVYDVKSWRAGGGLPGWPASVGPLALADMDGDGQLELFVGGQTVPGRYPMACSSLLARAQPAGGWTLDEESNRMLANVGLVNGGVWSDLDGDGFPELILAVEWGPLRVFHNERGKLRDITEASGLGAFTGLWQSVTTGDFDGDGQLDIVAGNWGNNSRWRATPAQPLTLFHGELSGRGGTDIVEAEFDPQSAQLAPRHLRDTLAASLPWIVERFPDHTAWSRATIASLLEGRQDKAQKLSAATLMTTVFLNRQGRFEAKPLPAEAQFAPVFGVCVADFDGDGHEDLFLAQNFFAFRVEDARLDAGRGLLLLGDGRGHWKVVGGQTSGLKIYGEQRGAAVADFNHDGRTDLVVTQNGAATRLFRNRTARAGLRVRLSGPPNNPDGIGAVVRLKFDGHLGPAREVHAGSGYWSQDSAALVLATPERPIALQTTWPGGRKTEQAIPSDSQEVVITY
jgi:hypothetical protein